MLYFEPVQPDLYKLRVPFENIYTGVFCIVTAAGAVIIDSAAGAYDIRQYILPALEALGKTLGNRTLAVRRILCTHAHGDHAGGLSALHARFPEAKIGAFSQSVCPALSVSAFETLSDGDILMDCIQVLHLPGHADDSAGFLDLRTKTLICGDSLQFFGVGRYGCGVASWSSYLETLNRLLEADIENIVASHDYVPMGGNASGAEAARAYIKGCLACAEQIRAFVRTECLLHRTEPKKIASTFNKRVGAARRLPPLPAASVRCIMKEEDWK